MKFIKDPFQFFIMSDFNFSLFWAIFWFLLVLTVLVRIEKSSITRYIDGVVLSFLFILVFWYIGAFFGWQVYGRETMMSIDILYSNPYTPVPYQVPVFPLPIIYTFLSFIIFFFAAMIIIFESFSGKQDILSVVSVFNLPQVYACMVIVWAWYNFSQIFIWKDTSWNITI